MWVVKAVEQIHRPSGRVVTRDHYLGEDTHHPVRDSGFFSEINRTLAVLGCSIAPDVLKDAMRGNTVPLGPKRTLRVNVYRVIEPERSLCYA